MRGKRRNSVSRDLLISMKSSDILYILQVYTRDVIYQNGFLGTVLAVLFYSTGYLNFVKYLRHTIGEDRLIFTFLLSFTHIISYIGWNLLYYIFDRFKLYEKFKINSEKSIVDNKLIYKTLLEALVVQLFINPLIAYSVYPLFPYFGMKNLEDELPNIIELIKCFILAKTTNDFAFYWTHRSLHSNQLYWLHKQHHEYNHTISIASEYSSLFENLYSNVTPTVLGVLIFPCHPIVIIVWLFLRTRQTYETHSGYCFHNTFLENIWLLHSRGSAHHHFHHARNKENYGEGEWMDFLFDTMNTYKRNGLMEGYIVSK